MQSIIDEKRSEITALCQRYHIERLMVFGSVLRDDFNPQTSDIDFVVELGEVPYGLRPERYFGLLEGLEELFQRNIDLLEEDAIRNPYLKEAIQSSQELLYAA